MWCAPAGGEHPALSAERQLPKFDREQIERHGSARIGCSSPVWRRGPSDGNSSLCSRFRPLPGQHDRPSTFQELNRSVVKLRGGAYHLLIKGVDELQLIHDNVMLEASCTSFQVHMQLNPARFATDYNASLLAAGPALAVAANSPMLVGRLLWQETRLAVFQHAVDERSHSHMVRFHPTRVSFGDCWIESAVLEIYKEQMRQPRCRTISLTKCEIGRWLRRC